ncbi:uncharacterized protein DSM5745_05581 [Aspergillus mulundensis]|uniref:F-box domain-containing protein n=1 Tax=Aspergillus mulundensis TaxID=1810919 RepID=A0A3D8RXD7_9EURO|nr:hypothetical protein DSM5745_05581 [Aspergillus mulundensis]RDW78729.1 hypothetical protein DSM5745_05581 [Aspergillus mulundensis]
MVHLLDLPDELLLMVIQCLDNDRPEISLNFWNLPRWCSQATKRCKRSQRVQHLHALLLVSRRFHSFVEPFFYRDLRVEEGQNAELYNTLTQNPRLLSHIKSAIINSSTFRRDGYNLLWKSPIQTLTLVKIDNLHPLEYVSQDDRAGNSSIQRLNLMRCSAEIPVLTAILRWPAALKAIHYDVTDQSRRHLPGRSSWNTGLRVPTWPCPSFVQALQSQKATLQEITMTRQFPPEAEEGPQIELCEFGSLSILRITYAFICNWGNSHDAWKSLPPNLETLEVFYDDEDWEIEFFEGWELPGFTDLDWEGAQWLRNLLDRKKTQFSKLSRITIRNPRSDPDNDLDIWPSETDEYMRPWKLPDLISKRCRDAGVELTVLVEEDPPSSIEDYDAIDIL